MLDNYYREPAVIQRMIEFLGGNCIDNVTAMYIVGRKYEAGINANPQSSDKILSFLDQEMEIFRSLWDKNYLLVHWDIEYVNFDYPAEPYITPQRSFFMQAPVIHAIQEELLLYGISPLHLLTGRGHSLVWQIRRDSTAFERLGNHGCLPTSLVGDYAVPQPPHGEPVGLALGSAFAGLGLVMEYLAHRAMEKAQPLCSIPIELTAIQTPFSSRGREIVSIDLSEYGDPLQTRSIRVPFSIYYKPQQQKHFLGESIVSDLPLLFVIPLHELDYQKGCHVMRNCRLTADLARVASVRIPDLSEETNQLIDVYEKSRLSEFHQWFYSEQQDPPQKWPETYDRTAYDQLPLCARDMLTNPNDRLLRPVGIQYMVRVLLSLGWHPRHIAGLLRSKYERNYDWGRLFFDYDASVRADFYSRLFSGSIVFGLDKLDNFNSQSLQKQGLCDLHTSRDSLAAYKLSLLNRIKYERLGCRPFHGLFFPDQHI